MMTMKRRVARLLAAGALAAAATAVASAPANATVADEWMGCPRGAVCLKTGSTFENPGSNIYVWWDGVYQLSNIYGNHVVVNAQTDNWVVDLCRGWNGDSCEYTLAASWAVIYQMTPINSVYLHP